MGTLKEELIDTEEKWNTKCQIENLGNYILKYASS